METMKPVALEKAYRLLNIGATTLVSAACDGKEDIMAAAWACALDLTPCKATVVIAKDHYTRPLIEKSGFFALSLPTLSIAKETLYLGSVSKNDEPAKLEKSGIETVKLEGFEMPLPKGAAAWMIFKLVPETHNQDTYDLFIGECVAAYADDRVFRDGHFYFDTAPAELKTLHYVAGGHFLTIGDSLEVSC